MNTKKVFEGDDGERFERNWLYWTGNDAEINNYLLVLIIVSCLLQELECYTDIFQNLLAFAELHYTNVGYNFP